jgi:hypothetical protein
MNNPIIAGAVAGFIAAICVVAIMKMENGYKRRWKAFIESFEDRDRRAVREALVAYPTYEAVMSALRYKDPCGCYHDWATGPPCGNSCEQHAFFGFSNAIPESVMVAWRAREALQKQGLFRPTGG